MSIYVVTHKQIPHIEQKGYKTICVNSNRARICADYYDNSGDNISNKNESYCELTALYWIWKNTSDDIIGIDHYRRFFIDDNSKISIEKVRSILSSYDIILPQKDTFKRKMGFRFWTTSGYKEDLTKIRKVLEKRFPEYLKDYDTFMDQYKMYSYNMMILSKPLYDKYCEWLFTILSDLEKQINPNNRYGYYRRIFGFIGERLLNVYIIHNKYRIKEIPIQYIGEKPSIIKRVIVRCKKAIDKAKGRKN
ncbi:MAG: DUF4422 domain-containing protein [Lachnospiraceae bacterium]|nr:DUF4422 domain-containing protein [Lachnospiraceae bacterium]